MDSGCRDELISATLALDDPTTKHTPVLAVVVAYMKELFQCVVRSVVPNNTHKYAVCLQMYLKAKMICKYLIEMYIAKC